MNSARLGHFVKGGDVGMIERSEKTGLPFEAGELFWMAGEGLGEGS
jgi:hypothetical protein